MKEAAGRKEEEGVGGIDGATWSAGACTRRGARLRGEAGEFLFI